VLSENRSFSRLQRYRWYQWNLLFLIPDNFKYQRVFPIAT